MNQQIELDLFPNSINGPRRMADVPQIEAERIYHETKFVFLACRANLPRRSQAEEGATAGQALRVPNQAVSEKSGTRATRPSDEFTNADIYAHARELEQLHPDNRHVRDKIRQQLPPSSDFGAASQVLRDAGLLIYVGPGVWRLP